jgi:hypothetical protein
VNCQDWRIGKRNSRILDPVSLTDFDKRATGEVRGWAASEGLVERGVIGVLSFACEPITTTVRVAWSHCSVEGTRAQYSIVVLQGSVVSTVEVENTVLGTPATVNRARGRRMWRRRGGTLVAGRRRQEHLTILDPRLDAKNRSRSSQQFWGERENTYGR